MGALAPWFLLGWISKQRRQLVGMKKAGLSHYTYVEKKGCDNSTQYVVYINFLSIIWSYCYLYCSNNIISGSRTTSLRIGRVSRTPFPEQQHLLSTRPEYNRVLKFSHNDAVHRFLKTQRLC